MAQPELSPSNLAASGALAEVNRRVQSDFDRYVDGPARTRITEAREELLFWLVAESVTRDGSLDRVEQKHVERRFGQGALDGLRRFLADRSRTDAALAIREKIGAAADAYHELMPQTAEREHESLVEEAARVAGGG